MIRPLPALLAAVGLGLCASGCHRSRPSVTPPPAPAPLPAANAPSTVTRSPEKAVVYTVDNKNGTDEGHYLTPKPVPIRHSQTPARDALQALLEAQDSPVAAGTQLRGIKIADGQATVDFSRSPVGEGGESGQSQALTAILQTLGQFPNIDTVQIEVQGKPVSDFGEFSSDGPLKVIRPEPNRTVASKGGA